MATQVRLRGSLALLLLAVNLLAASGGTIGAVRFEGNRAIARGTLGARIALKLNTLYSEGQIRHEITGLTEFYQQQGFLDVTVSSRLDTLPVPTGQTGPRLGLVFVITEGPRTVVRDIRIMGGERLSAGELQDLITVRRRLPMLGAELASSRTGIAEYGRDHGFFYLQCSVYVERVPRTDVSGIAAGRNGTSEADVRFEITEGPLCYTRRVNVRGLGRYRRALIDRYVDIRPGEVFCQTKLIDIQRRLYASRLFDRIYLTAVSTDPPDTPLASILARRTDSVDIRLDLAELSPRSVAFGGGIQFLPWRGLASAEWEHLNMFGQGHSFLVATSYSPVLSRDILLDYGLNLDLTYRIPYLTRWEINLAAKPFARWEFSYGRWNLEYGAENGASHDFSRNLNVALYNRIRWVNYSDTSATRSGPVLTARTNSLSAGLTYDSRNDLFSPVRGSYLRPSIELAGGFLGGTHDFYRVTLEGRHFRRLVGDHILALRAMTGVVLPYASSELVPYYEQFYLGGANSLRGYDEKAIGPVEVPTKTDTLHYGNFVASVNVEARSPYLRVNWSIIKGIGAVLFADGGTVLGGASGTGLLRAADEPVLHATGGVGLRVSTAIGPIRFDYGKRLTAAPPGDWGKLYFGILNMF